MSRTLDLIGKKFGRLTVLSRNIQNTSKRETQWNCVCDCGNKTVVVGHSLVRSYSTSCGCYRKEQSIEVNTTHAMSRTKTYVAWANLIQRCINKRHPDYKKYGAKGIKVCDSWLNSFESFYKDMGQKPAGKSSLRRIQTDGDYNKDNCKWVVSSNSPN